MTPISVVAMRLKQLRGKRGMSQEALAAKAGISRSYLAKLETAKHDPTLTVLEKLARALGVTIETLVK
jgi:transcriptional regulator with XRE-family HTH domain